MTRTREDSALFTVLHGHWYRRYQVCEGTVESGPYALLYVGFRWGQLKVELSPRGEVYVLGPFRWLADPYGGGWHQSFASLSTQGAAGSVVRRCLQALREGVQEEEEVREEPLPEA